MQKHALLLSQWTWLVLLWTSLTLTTWAQSIPDAQWARVGHTLDITTDGNVVTAEPLYFPPTVPGGLGQGGDQLVKYSLAGNKLWATGLLKGGFFLGGKIPGYDYESVGQITAAAAAANGGVTIAGSLSIRSSANVPVRIGADGSKGSWMDSDIFTSSGSDDFPRDLISTPDGGFMVLYSITQSDGLSSAIIRKYDAAKQVVWTQKIDYPNSNPPTPNRGLTKGNTIISAPDGGYLIVGYYNSAGAASPGVPWAAKLDDTGNVIWQKLIAIPALATFPGPNDVNSMSTITDAMVSADGTGYALVGLGLAYPYSNATMLVETDLNGNVKQGRAKAIDIQQATNAYITAYTGSGGKKLYAVGNTSLQSRVDPQLLLVDPGSLLVATKRTFQGPGESRLVDIGTAGDGSLVFATDNNQLVKLLPDTQAPTPPNGGALVLTQPTYNCQTGVITFSTTGGDGSPITYIAPGISRSSPTSNTGTVEQGLRNDPKPITITAMQSGNTVSYVFDFGAYCNGTQPPVTPPTGGALTLLAPDYNCATGAFTFKTTGGNGSTIEYQAAGITGWTTNPNQFVDKDSRTASDVKPFTLMARQNGVTVTYVWDLRAACNGTQPPVTPPTGGALTLVAPTYNCVSGAFTFNTTGGNGSTIEYAAVGITGWTTNPNQFVDKDSRTASDVKPFTLMARQSGVTVTYVWDLKAACGRAARLSASEPGTTLQVRVLGNPVINQTAEVEITGAGGQTLRVELLDGRGHVLHQQHLEPAEPVERVSVPLREHGGLFLLQVHTPNQHQTVKLIKP